MKEFCPMDAWPPGVPGAGKVQGTDRSIQGPPLPATGLARFYDAEPFRMLPRAERANSESIALSTGSRAP